MTISTRIYTLLCGQMVGTDQFGNRYYKRKRGMQGGGVTADRRSKEKRWVIYKGRAEPSKVPAEWHGWLHYTLDVPPTSVRHHDWEKTHLPNLTGTKGAYVPPGHLLRGGQRDASTADYEAWKP